MRIDRKNSQMTSALACARWSGPYATTRRLFRASTAAEGRSSTPLDAETGESPLGERCTGCTVYVKQPHSLPYCGSCTPGRTRRERMKMPWSFQRIDRVPHVQRIMESFVL